MSKKPTPSPVVKTKKPSAASVPTRGETADDKNISLMLQTSVFLSYDEDWGLTITTSSYKDSDDYPHHIQCIMDERGKGDKKITLGFMHSDIIRLRGALDRGIQFHEDKTGAKHSPGADATTITMPRKDLEALSEILLNNLRDVSSSITEYEDCLDEAARRHVEDEEDESIIHILRAAKAYHDVMRILGWVSLPDPAIYFHDKTLDSII